VSKPNVVIPAFKKAYDGNGIIMRLVEMEGRDTDIDVHLPDLSQTLYRVNLLEEEPELVEDINKISIKAHGIETFLIR
jgi:alpha-mannosidase